MCGFCENNEQSTVRPSTVSIIMQDEEFSDNDNADYYDEYDPMHNGIYQNGYLPHVVGDGDDNPNVEIFRKQYDNNNKNTNTSSSKSSSSNNSDANNLLPHYQPRWHQQLNHPFHNRNPLNSAYIKAHLESVNHEIAQLNMRMESILLKQHQACSGNGSGNGANANGTGISAGNRAAQPSQANAGDAQPAANDPAAIYRDPIDSMVAPLSNDIETKVPTINALSSPSLENRTNKLPAANATATSMTVNNSSVANKSLQQRQLPAIYPNASTPIESETEHIYETIPEDSESEPIYCSPYRGDDNEQQLVEEWLTDHQKRSSTGGKSPWSRTTKSVSSMEDHENSSSAYNTGGSCNSNHQLTLDLSDSCKDGNKTLTFCPTKHVPPRFGHSHGDNSAMRQSANAMTRSNSTSKKGKTVSPTHNGGRQHSQQKEHSLNATEKSGKLNQINTIE